MFPCQNSWDSGALWVRVKSRHLAGSLKLLAGNALYAYIGIELVCRYCYTRHVCSPSNSLVLLLEKRRTQDAIFQLVRLYYPRSTQCVTDSSSAVRRSEFRAATPRVYAHSWGSLFSNCSLLRWRCIRDRSDCTQECGCLRRWLSREQDCCFSFRTW